MCAQVYSVEDWKTHDRPEPVTRIIFGWWRNWTMHPDVKFFSQQSLHCLILFGRGVNQRCKMDNSCVEKCWRLSAQCEKAWVCFFQSNFWILHNVCPNFSSYLHPTKETHKPLYMYITYRETAKQTVVHFSAPLPMGLWCPMVAVLFWTFRMRMRMTCKHKSFCFLCGTSTMIQPGTSFLVLLEIRPQGKQLQEQNPSHLRGLQLTFSCTAADCTQQWNCENLYCMALSPPAEPWRQRCAQSRSESNIDVFSFVCFVTFCTRKSLQDRQVPHFTPEIVWPRDWQLISSETDKMHGTESHEGGQSWWWGKVLWCRGGGWKKKSWLLRVWGRRACQEECDGFWFWNRSIFLSCLLDFFPSYFPPTADRDEHPCQDFVARRDLCCHPAMLICVSVLPPLEAWFQGCSCNFEQLPFFGEKSPRTFFHPPPIFSTFAFFGIDISCHFEYFSDSGQKCFPTPHFSTFLLFGISWCCTDIYIPSCQWSKAWSNATKHSSFPNLVCFIQIFAQNTSSCASFLSPKDSDGNPKFS